MDQIGQYLENVMTQTLSSYRVPIDSSFRLRASTVLELRLVADIALACSNKFVLPET